MLKKKMLGYAMGVAAALALCASGVHAQDFGTTSNASNINANSFFNAGGNASSNSTAAGDFGNSTGLATNTNLTGLIGGIIKTIIGFLGVIAVVIILWGGFEWMTAGGDETKVKQARNRIVQGIIGLVIIIAAYSIAFFVINALTTTINAPTS